MRRRKQKRQPGSHTSGLSILLVLAVALFALTGCGNKADAEGQPQVTVLQSPAGQTAAAREKQQETQEKIEQEKEEKYRSALELMESERYKEAMEIFALLGEYRDASILSEDCEEKIREKELHLAYQEALQYMNEEKYDKAAELFTQLGDYNNAHEMADSCIEQYKAYRYDKAIEAVKKQNYSSALSWLDDIPEYEQAGILRYYCEQETKLTAARTALMNADYEGFLELVEELPNCDEKTDLYVKFANETLFDPDEAYRLHYSNELSFEKQYPKGTIWTINSYANGVDKDFWTGDYYLSLDGHEEVLFDVNFRCFDLPLNELESVNQHEHFVIVGEFSSYPGNFEFINCRVLSRTSDRGYAGVFAYSDKLYAISGAKEAINAYAGLPTLSYTAEAEASAPPPEQEESTENTNKGKVIELRCYSVELPSEWLERVYVSISKADKSIGFNEKKNFDAGYGGYLADICLMTKEEEAEYGFEHSVLGTLTSPDENESYYVVADLPGDVPYDLDNNSRKEAYLSAQEGLESVYESIKGINGWKYASLKYANSMTVSGAAEGGDVQLFKVPYYSVEVPAEISVQISVDLDEVGNAMWFDWIADDNSEKAYYLFGIILCTDRDFSSLDKIHPMNEILGSITTAHGEESYIVAVYPRPNSLLFEDEDMWIEYGEFANERIPQILDSIQGVNGCTYQVWDKNG